MTTYGNIVANGVEFPLMKMEVEFESLATPDSGRTDDGKMHIQWTNPRLRKIKCTLPPTSQLMVGTYLDAVQGNQYKLEYIDPIQGVMTLDVYTSNASAELYNARIHGGLWVNVSFNAIEIG